MVVLSGCMERTSRSKSVNFEFRNYTTEPQTIHVEVFKGESELVFSEEYLVEGAASSDGLSVRKVPDALEGGNYRIVADSPTKNPESISFEMTNCENPTVTFAISESYDGIVGSHDICGQ